MTGRCYINQELSAGERMTIGAGGLDAASGHEILEYAFLCSG